MEEEEGAASSCYISRKEENKNLCISGEDAKQSGDESWGIVTFERGKVREMRA
jgi:hypothetical protein